MAFWLKVTVHFGDEGSNMIAIKTSVVVHEKAFIILPTLDVVVCHSCDGEIVTIDVSALQLHLLVRTFLDSYIKQ